MLKIAYMEEDGYTGWKYKFNGFLWDTFWPIYKKYGTFYKLNMDMSGAGWDDYDADGIPYWEKTGTVDPDYEQPWKFVDPWTGDAFRIIKGGK
jgi:hypothetical protein